MKKVLDHETCEAQYMFSLKKNVYILAICCITYDDRFFKYYYNPKNKGVRVQSLYYQDFFNELPLWDAGFSVNIFSTQIFHKFNSRIVSKIDR